MPISLPRNAKLFSYTAVLLLSFPTGFWAQQDAAGVYKQSKDSVVLIEGEHHIGSGVIVPGGCPPATSCPVAWVVTNFHVVSGESSVTIKFATGVERSSAEVVASDPDADLVVLKVNGAGYSPAELGDSDSLAIGQRIFVISNPLGLQGSVTEGLISGVREIQQRKLLQISAAVSPGSSGGPVFDQQGRVVGIASATMVGAQNVNLAVPSSTIRTMLRNPAAAKLADLVPPRPADDGVLPILRRASAYIAKDMTDEAEAQLRSGIQQYESDVSLRLELAKLLVRAGRSEEGLQQLRATNKLAPDRWLPVVLMGHLYLGRWTSDGRLSDRRAAYQLYRDVLTKPGLPPAESEFLKKCFIEPLRSPEGEWITGDGQRAFSIKGKTTGGFFITLSDRDVKRLLDQPLYLQSQNVAFLAFPFDAEFYAGTGSETSADVKQSLNGEPGEFQGSSKHADTFCAYRQALRIEVSPDGSAMSIKGTITEVTGVLPTAVAAWGRKRAEGFCQRPGNAGLSLWLTRLAKKESFFALETALNTDTQPLVFREQ